MSRQIQIRRGTAAEHTNFTGAIGEITMDTTNNTLRVHDGVTAGGIALAKESAVPNLSNADYVIEYQTPKAENNYTWYRKYKSGWVEQGGIVSSSTGDGTVTMPITMANTDYQVQATNEAITNGNSWGWVYVSKDSKTTTGFSLSSRYGGGAEIHLRARWLVCGVAVQ